MYTVWFSYRKSPLGTAVRESMAAIVDVCGSIEEAKECVNILRERLSAEIKILNLDAVEDYEKIVRLDPDLIDVIRNSHGKKYVLLAFWGTTEP